MTAAICLIFFLSGAAALLFETLWFRLAGLVFGNSVWAASLVLASFMGGLALGNTLAARYGPRLRRPLRFYALLEALVLALTRTSSRTLPLWLLDSQESEIRIAARAGRTGPPNERVEYLRAIDAMARRDYAECARRLAALRARNPGSPRIAVLSVMALHLAGSTAEAVAEAASACQAGPSPPLDAETCAWLGRTFPAEP